MFVCAYMSHAFKVKNSKKRKTFTFTSLSASIKDHTLQNADVILGERPRELANLRLLPPGSNPTPHHSNKYARTVATTVSSLNRMMRTTVRPVARAVTLGTTTTTSPSPSSSFSSYPLTSTRTTSSPDWTTRSSSLVTTLAPSSTSGAAISASTTTTTAASTTLSAFLTSLLPTKKDLLLTSTPAAAGVTSAATSGAISTGLPTATYASDIFSDFDLQSDSKNNIPRFVDAVLNSTINLTSSDWNSGGELWRPNFNAHAEALTFTETGPLGLMANPGGNNTCGRINIMGTIVKDAAPYLFPFIIEYSLIGAAVIYVMWKHIGRHPRSPHQIEADLERKLEAMLSRRAVALANAGMYYLCFVL